MLVWFGSPAFGHANCGLVLVGGRGDKPIKDLSGLGPGLGPDPGPVALLLVIGSQNAVGGH